MRPCRSVQRRCGFAWAAVLSELQLSPDLVDLAPDGYQTTVSQQLLGAQAGAVDDNVEPAELPKVLHFALSDVPAGCLEPETGSTESNSLLAEECQELVDVYSIASHLVSQFVYPLLLMACDEEAADDTNHLHYIPFV